MDSTEKALREVAGLLKDANGKLDVRLGRLDEQYADHEQRLKLNERRLNLIEVAGPIDLTPGRLLEARESIGELVRQIGSGELMQKALSEGTGSAGGFLVPDEFLPEIQAVRAHQAVVRPRATVVTMNTDRMSLAALTTDVAVGWFAEGATITEADPVFSNPVLTARKQASRMAISTELVRDNQVDLLSFIGERWIGHFAQEEDRVAFKGDTGANPNEPMNGLLVDSGVNVVTLATGKDAFVETEPEDLLDLVNAVNPKDATAGVFIMHPSILNMFRKKRTSATGEFVVELPAAGVPFTGGAITTRLWGYEVVTSSEMPALSASAASTKFMAFGNLRNLVIGDRLGIEIAVSEHALFATDQIAVRGVARVGMALPRPAAFAVLKTSAT